MHYHFWALLIPISECVVSHPFCALSLPLQIQCITQTAALMLLPQGPLSWRQCLLAQITCIFFKRHLKNVFVVFPLLEGLD